MQCVKNAKLMKSLSLITILCMLAASLAPVFVFADSNEFTNTQVELKSYMPLAKTVYTDENFNSYTTSEEHYVPTGGGTGSYGIYMTGPESYSAGGTYMCSYRERSANDFYACVGKYGVMATKSNAGVDIDRLAIYCDIQGLTSAVSSDYATKEIYPQIYINGKTVFKTKLKSSSLVLRDAGGTAITDAMPFDSSGWGSVFVILKRTNTDSGYSVGIEAMAVNGVAVADEKYNSLVIDCDWWTASSKQLVKIGNIGEYHIGYDNFLVYEPYESDGSIVVDGISIKPMSVELLDENGVKLTKVPAPGEAVEYAYKVINRGKTVYCTAICALFANDTLQDTFIGDIVQLEEAVSNAKVSVSFDFPVINAYEGCTMKGFLWTYDGIVPLSQAIEINASDLYYNQSNEGWLSMELLKNSSFTDDNYVTGAWNIKTGGKTERIYDSSAEAGAYCRLYDRKSAWHGIHQDITDVLRKYGKGTYVLRVKQRYPDYDSAFTQSGGIKVEKTDGTTETKTFNISINQGDWIEYTSEINITVAPENIDKANIYFESCADTATSTYYGDLEFDEISLKKVLTTDKYFNDLMTPDNSVVFSEDMTDMQVFYPRASDEILINPYKGFVLYPNLLEYDDIYSGPVFGNTDADYSAAVDVSGVIYTRYSWAELEPTDDSFKWDMIKKNIELCRANGRKMALAVGMPANVNAGSAAQATPLWLFDKGSAYMTVTKNGTDYKIPEFNDQTFLAEYREFVESFSAEFNDDSDIIAYVDMRSFGNWGEWHLANIDASKTYTNAEYAALVDVWDSVTIPKMMFGDNTYAKNYAYSKNGQEIGIRVDGTMDPGNLWRNKRLAERAGTAPSVSEWWKDPMTIAEYNVEGQSYEPYLEIFYERVIDEGKTSYAALGYWDFKGFYKKYKDVCDRLANRIGYWFKPVKIAYSDLYGGKFSMLVKNDGVNQLYCDGAVVKLALADSSGNVIEQKTLTGLDPTKWQAGEYSKYTGSFDFSAGSGADKLLLGVFTSDGIESPDIKLGIGGRLENGWYDITSADGAAKLSDNRLYSSNTLYADLNYGYRRAEHAFDESADTYWASECKKGSYLEIDFGEEVSPHSFKICSAEDITVDYSVQVYRNGFWGTVGTGTSISVDGNVISGDFKTITKARFVINEASIGKTVKISAFEVE